VTDASKAPLRILLELRPALGGHAGIPQATRLLFRSLAPLDGVRVEGLLQSPGRPLPPGLPAEESGWFGALSKGGELNRLGRVVIALEQDNWGSRPRAVADTIVMALKHLLGGSQQLSRFDAAHFKDYVWRRIFARTLPPDDFDIVTLAGFRIARIPWNAMHICALLTRKFGYALYPRLDTSDFDVMIAETPYPGTVSDNTKLIIRYHDAIPMMMPHTIADRRFHQAFHYRALCKNVAAGAWFVCVSDASRKDLLSIFPQAEERSITIHNMVSHHYSSEPSDANRVPEIVRTRRNMRIRLRPGSALKQKLYDAVSEVAAFDYLLVVSTIEPRKNHLTLLSAWEKLRVERFPTLQLIMVGALGWHHNQIIRKFRPWLEHGDAFLLEDVPAPELRLLYAHARATVCASLGEGFDFSGVEAMKCGSPVVASDIPVHREVFADGAEYFNPYSVDALAHSLQSAIDPIHTLRRDELITKGGSVAQRYVHDSILPQWQAFLQLRSSPAQSPAKPQGSPAWT
jgi:glycosyltransferase involved in cell wall biosynthesis